MTHTFYKNCSEKPRRIGRRNALHTFYKKCSTVRRTRTAAHQSRAAQFRRANALRMDFTPQLTIKPDEDLEGSEPTAILHPSSFTLHSPTPNLSTPAFALA